MKHPYPEHVVEAVARGIKPSAFRDRSNDWIRPSPNAIRILQEKAREDAESALQALWDASRIDSVSQAEQLSDDVRAITPKGAYMAPWSLDRDDLPAHIIDWGDTSE